MRKVNLNALDEYAERMEAKKKRPQPADAVTYDVTLSEESHGFINCVLSKLLRQVNESVATHREQNREMTDKRRREYEMLTRAISEFNSIKIKS